jgi:hypothetical protein
VGATKPFVFGVGGVGGLPIGVLGGQAGELVGAGEDEATNEFFEGPAVGHEVVGEVVEQEGVGGEITGGAEVIDGADEALAEEVHPDAVDEDAGGEGILRMGDPLSELEAAALISWNGGGVGNLGSLDEATRDGGAEVADIATDVDGAVGRGGVVQHAHGFWAFGTGFFEGFDLFFEGFLLIQCGGQSDGVAGGTGFFLGGTGFFIEQPDGIKGDVAGGAFIGDEDESSAVFFKAEGAEGDEAGVDGRGGALVDGEVFLAVGVEDVDGDFGITAGGGGVGDADFVAPGLGDGGNEGGGAVAFGGLAVVDVAGADEVGETGGLDPGPDELGLGVVHDEAGELAGGDGFVWREAICGGLVLFDLGGDGFELGLKFGKVGLFGAQFGFFFRGER